MTGKKIGRRQLLRLLPGAALAAMVGVSEVVAAGNSPEEVVEVDTEQLARAVWDTPILEIDHTAADGKIIDSVELGIGWVHSADSSISVNVDAGFAPDIVVSAARGAK